MLRHSQPVELLKEQQSQLSGVYTTSQLICNFCFMKQVQKIVSTVYDHVYVAVWQVGATAVVQALVPFARMNVCSSHKNT